MKNRWIAGICLLAALVAVACSRPAASGEEEASGEAPAAVPEVTVVKITRSDISRTLTLPGVVVPVPNQDARISALVGGRVVELSVAEGDAVRTGQLLARLDEAPLRGALERAEAAASQARANLENAKLSLARNQDLLNRGIAARKDAEDARTAEQVAEAAVQQAEADVELAKLNLARARVASPLGGIIVKRFVNVGEQVDGTAAQPLVEVANLNEVELNASAPPDEAGQFHPGEIIPFTSGVFPGKKFSGRVLAVSPAVEAASNAALVRIRVSNAQGLLRLGMFLSAAIPVEKHSKVLVVAPQAVYRDSEGQPILYRVADNQATSIPVKLGIETPEQVELVSGVAEGDTVILDGGYGLADQSKVSVKKETGPQ